jgi:hypothetical protein
MVLKTLPEWRAAYEKLTFGGFSHHPIRHWILETVDLDKWMELSMTSVSAAFQE